MNLSHGQTTSGDIMHKASKVCFAPPGTPHSMYQHRLHRSSGQTGLFVYLRFLHSEAGPLTSARVPVGATGGVTNTTCWSLFSSVLLLLGPVAAAAAGAGCSGAVAAAAAAAAASAGGSA